MKVLLVIHHEWWQRKSPPFWPDQFDALAAHPDVTIKVTGPRWPDYDNAKTLRDNVEVIMPDADVLYLWRPFGIAEFSGIRGADEKLPQLKVSAYQDDATVSIPEARNAGLDLLFYHDHWDRQFYGKSGIRSVYLPLAVNLPLFDAWDRNQSQRPTQVLLTGNLNPVIYPLRARYHSMISKGLVKGRVRKQSPYRMPSLSAIREEQKAYSSALCFTRISLVSTSPKYPLTLRKYFESMAAGCVVFGDMPHSPPDDVRGCINEVTAKMSGQEIASRIKRMLNNPAECERQRLRNRSIAEKYGYGQFAERWVATVRESLESR